MAVLCPRCGEYTSIIDEHCKKCGFSIKNYYENQKKFRSGNTVENEANGSSSICLKEIESNVKKDNTKFIDKSDEIQENLMRLLSNVSLTSSNEKGKENTLAKKEPVKIIAKKVADDVIILPTNRVKVEIEAAKEVVKEIEKDLAKDFNKEEMSDEMVEDRINKIKKELAQNKEFIDKLEDMGMKQDEENIIENNSNISEEVPKIFKEINEDNNNEEKIKKTEEAELKADKIKEKNDKEYVAQEVDIEKVETEKERKAREEQEAREAEIHARAIPSTESYSFREFLEEGRENNISKKITLMVGIAILLLILLIMLITSAATAATF